MSAWIMAGKRMARAWSFWLLLLLCAGAVFLAALPGAAGSRPPAGLLVAGESEVSRRIAAFLQDNDFVLLSDAREAREKVASGELDVAVFLPADLERRLAGGELAGAVELLCAPDSFAPELYRELAAAALFREAAPYITAGAFTGTPVTEAEVLAEYEALFAGGYAFSFTVETAGEGGAPGDRRGQAVLKLAAGTLLMTALFLSGGQVLSGDHPALCRRLGAGRVLVHVLLPQLLLRTALAAVLTALALGLGTAAGGRDDARALIPGAMAACVTLSGGGLLAAALLPGRQSVTVLLPLLVIAALGLCPVYTDPALLFPPAAWLRWAVPAYWLWPAAERPGLWLGVGAALLALGLGAAYGRGRGTHGR